MRNTLLALSLAAFAVAPLNAQESEAPLKPVDGFAGFSFIIAQPQQEFADYLNTSFGGSVYGLWRPKEGVLGLRFEGGAIGYGQETQRLRFANTSRVTLDLTTSNIIGFGHVGPQFTLPGARVQPYIAPSIGATYIATVSSVSGHDNAESFASETNYHDWLFSYGATAGVYVPVSRGRTPVMIDFSARYNQNGNAHYLVKGSIQDNDDGTISYAPISSSANMLTFQVGVSIGVRDTDHKSKHD